MIKISKEFRNLPLSALVKFLFLPCKKGSDDLKSDIKSLVASKFPIFFKFKIKPSCFKTDAPLSIHFEANGMSEVTTISLDLYFQISIYLLHLILQNYN